MFCYKNESHYIYDDNLVYGHDKISLQLCLRRVQVLFTVSRPAGQG